MARLFKGAEYLFADADPSDAFTPEDVTEEQRQIAKTTEAFVAEEVMPVYERLEHQEPGLARALMARRARPGSS